MILDGKKLAKQIRSSIKSQVEAIEGRKPSLSVILVGDDPASVTYVTAKQKACTEATMTSNLIRLPQTISESDLIKKVEELNADLEVDGILVQLPLPSHINPNRVILKIDPRKDVDGLHPVNMGKLLLGFSEGLMPCTPLGIKVLLQENHIHLEGKHVVIVGRSNIVGKPLAAMLMQKQPGCNATITVVHSRSQNLINIIQSADVLVASLGKPQFIQADMIKKGSTIIDVGIHRKDGKLIGDVDPQALSKAAHFTPVPGGVGPMTIAMLLKNTLLAFSKLALFILLFTGCSKEESCTYLEGKVHQEKYEITIGDPLNNQIPKNLQTEIENTLRTTFNQFDLENPNSELFQLNVAKKGDLIPLSTQMQKVLQQALNITKLSSNRFDPTIEPIAKAWAQNKDPSLEQILEVTGVEHISIQNGIFSKANDQTELTLGAVAKGYALDQVFDLLIEKGFKNFLVQWAGKIRAKGHHPKASDWVVRVNPALTQNNQNIAPIPLRNAALSTSGMHIEKIIDPMTAYPIESTDFSIRYAVVIAPTCELADALATTAMLFPTRKEAEHWAEEVVAAYPEVSFWILSRR